MPSFSTPLRRAGLAAALGALPAALLAQTTEPATLQEIRVEATPERETATGPVYGYAARRSATATKTDTPLHETPQSVTVVTRDQLTDQGTTNLQDALGYAAGVRSDAYGIDSRADSVRIRGTEPTLYLDGLRQHYDYYTSTTRIEPYTLERLEVLRGPAAMLYGQGSTGGIINMVSKRPQAEFQGEAGIQLGNRGRKQAQVDLTGPLTADGQWLYRLVALKRDADTQVDHVKDNRSLVMPSLTWRPSASTSLTLQGLWQKDESGSTAQFMPWSGMRTDNPNGRIPTSRFIGEPGHDRYDSRRTSFGWLFEHRFNDQWSFSQGFRHANNKVDYLTHYADSFTDPGGWAADPINQRRIARYADDAITKVRIDTLDQHLTGKLQTGIVQHQVLLGFDWTRYRRDRRSGAADGGTIDAYDPVYGNYTPPVLTDEPRYTLRQAGLYLQDQMKIGKHWIVAAGVRHDRTTAGLAGSADEKDNATTKRLGVMYVADNGLAPYINYSESFTPVPGTDKDGARFKPLRGEQWELGVKHQSADGRRMATASVYQLKEKNQLAGDPANPLYSIQVGATKTKGLELEYRGAITRGFDLIAHYNYIDLDKSLEGMPRHQAAAWGKWRFALGGVNGFALGAGVRWMSSFRDGVAPTTPLVTLFDAMVSYETDHWRYALNLNNLTDKTYVATCLSRGDCWYGARRSIIASATYKF
ncbi:TonB-dependent siderophore receptor [Pigmentiphaga sp. NML030171]|uniref:TonB-dependent siderophore receptor n=1 Tax=Pigmentiphaga sp. NML030171 TaxID=2008676 RepID=UPI000B4189A3|nr:TonB-dependent siderophore receptor [Pigmentiphaga sp. NML030171]OVZ66045.1 TonB-dependent siderophore receptor [Pigmentiphaga sp. NML030171]